MNPVERFEINSKIGRMICCFISLFFNTSVLVAEEADENEAVQKALTAIERGGRDWIKEQQCVSCHQIPYMAWSLGSAVDAGYEFDQTAFLELTSWTFEPTHLAAPENREEFDQAASFNSNHDTLVQFLLAGHNTTSVSTQVALKDEYVHSILLNQEEAGFWKPRGQLPQQRRSARETREVTTLWTLIALGNLERQSTEIKAAMNRAEDWLGIKTEGASTEWLVTKYLYYLQSKKMKWAKHFLQEILAAQNGDGGWGWLRNEGSDAFGTGIALYALGYASSDRIGKARLNAIDYLVETQADDGGWSVPSTLKRKFPEVTPTASYWGTCWAVLGLVGE